MPTGDYVYNSGDGSVFFQPDGPGTELKWLGCHDVDDIEAPQGEIEINQAFRADRSGWDVIGQRKAPPEPVTTTITGMSKKTRDYLEKARCSNGALYIMLSTCSNKSNPLNYERAQVLHHINIDSITYAGRVHHNEANDATHAMSVQAWPPLIEAVEVSVGRVALSETQSLNDIWADAAGQCLGDCGQAVDPGDVAVIAADSAAGPATGNILFTSDGATWAAGAADPFGAGINTMAITAFPIGKTGRRYLAGKEGPAGGQGQVAYSDNAGASWTLKSIGGAAAGHGASAGGCLFALSRDMILLAGKAGYIYKSTDGGETWRAVESGVITAGAYSHVHFADEKYGVAVAASGVTAVTRDGGETWTAGAVVTGTPGLNCVFVFNDRRVQVGTATGLLYQSNDFGTTWVGITGWTGSGIGQVRDIDYVNDFVGFMASNTAAPVGTVLRTIDGGANWLALTTPLNSGLNAVKALTENSCYAVGEANGGTGLLLKINEN
jgi:photosystem II stability/assembly factor-like uncharacterized protein